MAFLLACSTVHTRLCGEMDITTVFGTVVPGSSPGGGTQEKPIRFLYLPQLQTAKMLKYEGEYENI